MKPRGLLMIEHRIIERMISIIDKEIKRFDSGERPDSRFIDTAIDFIRSYADRNDTGDGSLFDSFYLIPSSL